MRCLSCASENPEGLKFCEQCAAPLKRRCARCRFENSPAAKFCGRCASPLYELPFSPDPVHKSFVATGSDGQFIEGRDGERKIVTTLAADIKGSMDMIEGLDPEEASAIVDPALRLMIDAVHGYGGYIVQSTGDGVFALFGAPIANEDHPQRAILAAMRMQEEIARYSMRVKDRHGIDFQVRVGINTGEVVVREVATETGRSEYSPIGHSAGLASRLQALARPGAIVVGEATRKLVEGYFGLRSMGPATVKGVSEPVGVFEVSGPGKMRTRLDRAASRGFTKFVGRARDIGELDRIAQSVLRGQGHVLAVVAEAGVGKSRLIWEFRAGLAGDWQVIETACESQRIGSAYQPMIHLVRQCFSISSVDDIHAANEKLDLGVASIGPAIGAARPYLASLLGLAERDPLAQMDPKIREHRTCEAILQLIQQRTLSHPMIAIVEDLHWIDPESQALLDALVDGLGRTRMLLLVSYRPEYSHKWSGRTYYTQLNIGPLEKDASGQIVTSILGNDQSIAPLARRIVDQTEGNPLFIEEIARSLIDEKSVVIGQGVAKLIKPLTAVRLPPTVQGILAARIDRLPPAERTLLQTLAVAGDEVPLAIVRRMAGTDEDDLSRMLVGLQRGEFIYPEPRAREVVYAFKHALMRKVAIDLLLSERRKVIHERIGEALEAAYPDQLRAHAADLAHHYSSSTNVKKALKYLTLAGVESLRRSTYSDAISQFSKAIERLGSVADDRDREDAEIELQSHLGQALWASRGPAAPEVQRAYSRARELCEKAGKDELLFPVLAGLRTSHIFRLEIEQALALDRQMLELAERARDPAMLATAHALLARTILSTGDLSASLEHSEHLLSMPTGRRAQGRFASEHWRIIGIADAAYTLWFLGFPDTARRRIDEALKLAGEFGRSVSLTSVLNAAARFEQLSGNAQAAALHADAAIEIAREHGFSLELARAGAVRAWVTAVGGRLDEGLSAICEHIANYEALGARRTTWHLATIAEIFCLSGHHDRALESVEKALSIAGQTGERYLEPELYRLKGEFMLLLSRVSPQDAEANFRHALETAHRHGAKSWELRSAVSLGGLLRAQDRCDEGREILEAITQKFEEGHDTPDMIAAMRLLDSFRIRLEGDF